MGAPQFEIENSENVEKNFQINELLDDIERKQIGKNLALCRSTPYTL